MDRPAAVRGPVPDGRILDDSIASKPQGLVCAPDLATQAGLSSNELQFLQSLGIRRSLKPGQLPRGALDYLLPQQRACYFFERAAQVADVEARP